MHLMISVVSAAEAEKAISCGATLLDIKNPEEGSLGAPFPHVIRRIKDMASDRIRISAAIGDMPNLPGTAALAALGAAACGADYVKAGLRGQSSMQEALALICAVRDALAGRNTDVVAAAYADFRRIGTLDPNAVLDAAAEAGIQGFLVDTALKDGNTLFDWLNPGELAEMAQRAHASGLFFAAAGSLKKEQLTLLLECGADIAGVRTAVCRDGNRMGTLDPNRVREFTAALEFRRFDSSHGV